jgi:TonB family protein
VNVRLLALATATSSLIATPAHAEDAFAPSGPWAIDYDADSCALRRSYWAGDEMVYVEIRRFAPGSALQTTIGNSRARQIARPRVAYRFTDDEDWQEPGLGVSVTLASGVNAVIFEPSFLDLPELEAIEDEAERAAYMRSVDLGAIERQQAAAINSIRIRGIGPEFILPLGKFSGPIGALQDCTDELTSHWGIDVEAHKTLTRRAQPTNWRAGARMLDYPPAMFRRGLPGLVNVRLSIDETGKVTACRIQMPLSDPAFEVSSCADIQEAFKFEPALDKDGKPIASYWTTRVRFDIGTPFIRGSF